MFRIQEDITIQYWNGELFIIIIQQGNKYSLEITNRRKGIVKIELEELEQGKIIVGQILPTLNRIENYVEAKKLLNVFSSSSSYMEAVFLIRVYKCGLSFNNIDELTKIYQLQTKIHCGQMTINKVDYDLSFHVFWPGISKPIGNFAGFFNKRFIFIRRKRFPLNPK